MTNAITDTGPPLHLHQIGYVRLLEIFESLIVSGQVKAELRHFNTWNSIRNDSRIHIQEEIVTENEINEEQRRGDYKIHHADLSVLVLAHRMMDAITLTDDLKLRRVIEKIGRYVSGSVGVLIKGYKKGKLNKNELQKSIDLLFNDSSLYLSRAFRYKVLKLVEQQEKKR